MASSHPMHGLADNLKIIRWLEAIRWWSAQQNSHRTSVRRNDV